ncbi:MAG: GNAT family N-acetyltransferase [Bacillota bacterium]
MHPITVRPARPGDFEAVSALLAELGRPAVTKNNRGRLQEIYGRHLSRHDTASLVALYGDRIVGFVSLEFRDRLNRESPQAWVPDLIVTEGARGTGAGKALLHDRRGLFSAIN